MEKEKELNLFKDHQTKVIYLSKFSYFQTVNYKLL